MLTGSMVAMVTPMADDGSVDWAGLERLVNHHVEQGTDAIVSVGTTGESATLDHNEHIEVIGRTVDAAAGRIPVIGGTGANSTAEAIALTRDAAAVGVTA
jgi:4-hydroxy-tetrahydrodipicolinate synthase